MGLGILATSQLRSLLSATGTSEGNNEVADLQPCRLTMQLMPQRSMGCLAQPARPGVDVGHA